MPRMEDPRARAPQLMRTRMYGCWPRNIIAVIRWNWDSSALTRVLEASTWQLRFEPRLFIFRTFHPREFVPFLRYQARVIRNRIGSDPILCFRVKRYKYSLFFASFSSFFYFSWWPSELSDVTFFRSRVWNRKLWVKCTWLVLLRSKEIRVSSFNSSVIQSRVKVVPDT